MSGKSDTGTSQWLYAAAVLSMIAASVLNWWEGNLIPTGLFLVSGTTLAYIWYDERRLRTNAI